MSLSAGIFKYTPEQNFSNAFSFSLLCCYKFVNIENEYYTYQNRVNIIAKRQNKPTNSKESHVKSFWTSF